MATKADTINSASTWQHCQDLLAQDQDQRGSDGVQLACNELQCQGQPPTLAAEKTTI